MHLHPKETKYDPCLLIECVYEYGLFIAAHPFLTSHHLHRAVYGHSGFLRIAVLGPSEACLTHIAIRGRIFDYTARMGLSPNFSLPENHLRQSCLPDALPGDVGAAAEPNSPRLEHSHCLQRPARPLSAAGDFRGVFQKVCLE